MENRYRVKTSFSRFDRKTLKTRKCFYLSVEGNCTEREYFEGFEHNKKELGINGYVRVSVLKRRKNDNHSLPTEVVELIDEFINLHDGNIDPTEIGLPSNILRKFTIEELTSFLNGNEDLPEKRAKELEEALIPCSLGLCYRNFKEDYDPEKDIFAVIIDRDHYTHSQTMIEECIKECEEKGYDFYIVNPCFEFWLLMHKSDIRNEYKDKLEEIRDNRKNSNKHTVVSDLLSKKANHGKRNISFEHNYLPFVDYAVRQSRTFETDKHKLIDDIGTNLADLIDKMRK